MSVLAGQPQTSIEPMMLYMGRLAREAARELALAATAHKNAALETMAKRVEARAGAILEANKNDIDAARGKGRDDAFIDRLALERGTGGGDGDRIARYRRACPIRSAR